MAMIQDCDRAVNRICDMCDWTEDLRKVMLKDTDEAKTTTDHTAAHTTKPKEQQYTTHKQTSQSKTEHTHRTNNNV